MKLSKETMQKIIFGGIYKVDMSKIGEYSKVYTNPLNDQRYGWFVPVHYMNDKEDNYYMVDTYLIDRQLYDNLYTNDKSEYIDCLVNTLKSLSNADQGRRVFYMVYNHYYGCAIKLTDTTINLFTLIADLSHYKLTDVNECRYYNDSDVVKGVKLYNEHNYPDGIIIVKKEAVYSYNNLINAKINDVINYIRKPNYCSDYFINELIQIQKEADEKGCNYDKEKLNAILDYNKFMKELSNITDMYINKNINLSKKYYI